MAVTKFAWPAAKGLAMRATALDNCGKPLATNSVVTSDGFLNLKPSPEYEEAEKIRQKNAADRIYLVDEPPASLVNVGVEIEFLDVDPNLFNIAGAATLVLDNQQKANGIGLDTFAVPGYWALEWWTDVPGTACSADGKPFGYGLIPFLSGAQIQGWTHEAKNATFTLKATSRLGNAWGKGPYKVEKNGATAPFTDGPLVTAIPTDRHLHLIKTYTAVPAVTGGAVDLAEVPEYVAPTP